MTLKHFILAGVAVVALGAVGASATGRYVAAQEGDAAAVGAPRKDALLARVAANLGVTTEELQAAITQAKLDGVDDALTSGRIDEARATELRQRIENGEPLRDRGERREHRQRVVKALRGLLESAAGALGMEPNALKAELKEGASVADVAAVHGVPLADVKARVLADAEAKLDEAVANGRIDQARSDALLAKLNERIDDLLAKQRQPRADQ